jgi:hypothetical protein
MHKLKVYFLSEDDDDEKYKKFVLVVPKQKDELKPRVKYKEILKEEDDFLDENNF